MTRSLKREKCVEELMVLVDACRTIPADSIVQDVLCLLKRVVLQSRAGAIPPLVVLEADVPAGLLKVDHLLALAHLPLLCKESLAGWSISFPSEEPPSYNGLFTLRAREMAGKKVREVMHPFPVSLKPRDSLSRAAYLMTRTGFEILPVEEDNRVLGLLRDKELFLELSRIVTEVKK
ncbi:CBS domain-containing protein [Desulfofundulus sp.]|uniref:CBS domain-containing protein n=1 Tax=Desulfofundulus sp. TaxID=2282750 RepID=UPI003C75BCF7